MSIIQDLQNFFSKLIGKKDDTLEPEKENVFKVDLQNERSSKTEKYEIFKNDDLFTMPPLPKNFSLPDNMDNSRESAKQSHLFYQAFRTIPNKIAGIELHFQDKVSLIAYKYAGAIGGTTNIDLQLVEDPKSKNLAIRLSEIKQGKTDKIEDYAHELRWVSKNEVILPSKLSHKIDEADKTQILKQDNSVDTTTPDLLKTTHENPKKSTMNKPEINEDHIFKMPPYPESVSKEMYKREPHQSGSDIPSSMVEKIPDMITGIKLDITDKHRLLQDGILENVGYQSGKNLYIIEDPKSKELSIGLSQLVVGKNHDDISEVSRTINKRDISSIPYAESSGLGKELQDKGITTSSLLKEPNLQNVTPEVAKAIEIKASIALSKSHNYSVIDNKTSNDDSKVTFHPSLKDAARTANELGGSLAKTKDVKDSISYQKEGGDINISSQIKPTLEKNEYNLKIR